MLVEDMLFQMANYVEWLCSSGTYYMNQCGGEMEIQLSKSQKSDSIGVISLDIYDWKGIHHRQGNYK